MYHQISEPSPRRTPYRGLTVSPKSFERQMNLMRFLGYQGLSIKETIPYLIRKNADKIFGITFDDGFRNVYDYALPVLQRFGFTATSYFVVRQIGRTNAWDSGKGVPSSPLMTSKEILQWALSGNEVGSHTLDHVYLSRVSTAVAQKQIFDSKKELEQILGISVTAFCYPYGDYRVEHQVMVRDAGYTNATSTIHGFVENTDNVFSLPRISISRSMYLPQFFWKCLMNH